MTEIAIIAYLPVLHRGYLDFFRRQQALVCPETQARHFVLGQEIISQIDGVLGYLRKEIRSLTPQEACLALSAIGINPVQILTEADCLKIVEGYQRVIMPEEDVSRLLLEIYFSGLTVPVTFDPVFLRWNRDNIKNSRGVEADRTVPISSLDREMMTLAVVNSEHSSDWWRQVGAVATTASGTVLFTSHNLHLPSPWTPYYDGDPRNVLHRGEGLDLYTSIHAEADLVAKAANKGISLAGAYFYVSTFPCPSCARLLARVGIARLYCLHDYSLLDGFDILRQAGVEIVKVE